MKKKSLLHFKHNILDYLRTVNNYIMCKKRIIDSYIKHSIRFSL